MATSTSPLPTSTSPLPSYFDTGVYLKLYPPGEANMEEGRVKDALGKEVGLKWCRVDRDRMVQGESSQLYWVGFFHFGPFPEENMFGFFFI